MAAVLALATLVAVERRARSPLLDRELLSGRLVRSAYVVTLTLFFALFGVIFCATLYLQAVRGLTPLRAGLHLLPATASIGLTAPLAALATRRFGPRPPVVLGLTVMAVAVIGMRRAGVGSGFGAYWWALLLLGLGAGSVLTPLAASVLESVPDERAGVAAATMAGARELGGAIGVAAVGAVVLARMQHTLEHSLGGAGVPTGERAALAHRIVQGAIARSTAAGGAAGDSPVGGLARQAYVTGMHSALLVTACVLATGAVVALAWLRPDPTRAQTPPATAGSTGRPGSAVSSP